MAAKQNIFTIAQGIRKAHPRMEWKDAVAKAGKQVKSGKVAGVKKRKRVGAVGRVAKPKKMPTKVIKATVKIGSVGGCLGAIGKARKISGNIDKMEKAYKTERKKEVKQIIATLINKEHDRLDALHRQYKNLK